MNAFLYDVDPQSGDTVGAAMGNIDDPTIVEVTTDCRGTTGDGSVDADPDRRKLIDQFTNPFPHTYSITGFGTTGDARHGGGAVCSFVDGHVALLAATQLGGNMSPYSIPRSGGRMYVNLSQTKNYADAHQRLYSAFHGGAFHADSNGNLGTIGPNAGTPTDDTNFSPSTGWTITGPGAMELYPWAGGFVPTGGGTQTLMINAEVTSNTTFVFGDVNILIESVPQPSTPGDDDQLASQKAFLFDNPKHYVQGGSLKAYSNYAYASDGYGNPYTPKSWIPIDLPSRGKRFALPGTPTKIHLEVKMVQGGFWSKWPTGQQWVYSAGTDPAGDLTGSCPITGYTEWKLVTPDTTITYSGPFVTYVYGASYGKWLTVPTGKLTIKDILYSSG